MTRRKTSDMMSMEKKELYMNTDIILQTHQLTKVFGTVRAVDGVSLGVTR